MFRGIENSTFIYQCMIYIPNSFETEAATYSSVITVLHICTYKFILYLSRYTRVLDRGFLTFINIYRYTLLSFVCGGKIGSISRSE